MTRRWALDTVERALSTSAQALLALLPASYLPGVVIDLPAALLAALFAGAICVVKCVAALRVGDADTASLIPDDRGHTSTDLLLVACLIGVVLLLFGVTLR